VTPLTTMKKFSSSCVGKDRPAVLRAREERVAQYGSGSAAKRWADGVDFGTVSTAGLGRTRRRRGSQALAEVVPIIDSSPATKQWRSYVEILAKPGHRTERVLAPV